MELVIAGVVAGLVAYVAGYIVGYGTGVTHTESRWSDAVARKQDSEWAR